jgi:hypothetical protein
MGFECWINVRLFWRPRLDARLDMNVITQILGEQRKGAAHSNHQKYSKGEASRELFAVQHRPH